MTLETKKLYQITEEICRYLNLDENLFFCAGHVAIRIHEGRRYFCYIAKKEFNIPVARICKFLGYDQNRTVWGHIENIRTMYSKDISPQLTKDIDTIIQNCKP
jgi:hypothetical protein